MKAMHKLKRSCPVCSGTVVLFKKGLFDTRFGVGGWFDFYRCGRCDLVKISHIPAHGGQKELYETYYNYAGQRHKRYDRIKKKFFNSVLYAFWMRIDGDICFHSKKGHGKLLDVGCNQGAGLILYQRRGYTVEGLEVNSLAAESARAKGLKVNIGNIETYNTKSRFDIVVLSNILEHSIVPVKVLEQAHRFLKPAGEVWISTPNLNSLFRSVFGKHWINWHVPFHMCLFSRKALGEMLPKAGFRVKATKNISPSLWNAQSIISVLYSQIGQKTRQHRNTVLISVLLIAIRLFLFPALYLINLAERGDCILVTARKI